jgi:hypothetical protein
MNTSRASDGWSLAGSIAGTLPPLPSATVDVAAPGGGVEPCRPSDQWIRGSDLIAVYEPDDSRRLRATALWRPRSAPAGIAAWELVLSAQTALVQSDSAVAVVSQSPAAGAAWGGTTNSGRRWIPAEPGDLRPTAATCVLLHGGNGPRPSLLVAVHPQDVRQIEIDREADLFRVRCWLFSTAIEKGQLFRSRVLAAVGPAQDDEAWSARLVAEFAATPAPLTT